MSMFTPDDYPEIDLKGETVRVAISGGRTSMYMAKWMKRRCLNGRLVFTFANTGLEHPDTLRFLHEGAKALDIDVVWLEAVVHHGERRSSGYRVVNYETASRNGEPFWEVMSKYGIPNRTFMLCTRELKANVMHAYARDVIGPCLTAIGIRADERRRATGNERFVYPLVEWWPTHKQDVLDDLSQYEWDLRIPEHLGNCVTCFQKSDKKLAAVYREHPDSFDFFARAEVAFEGVGPNNVPGPRRFFRGYRSVADMRNLFNIIGAPLSIEDGGCSESCEPFPMEEAS